MSEKFDKILSDKIKDSLEQHKIVYDPEHWEQLKAKKNKNKRVAFWYWRVASILVVLLSISLFVNYFVDKSSDGKNDFKQKVNKENPTPKTIKDSLQNSQETFVAETTDSIKKRLNSSDKLQNTYKQPQNKTIQNNIAINKTIENNKTSDADLIIEYENNKVKSILNNENIELSLTNEKKDSLVKNKDLLMEPSDSILNSLNLLEDNSINVEKKLLDKKLKMGVLISSLYNVHDNKSSDDMAISSGLSLEIPLSNKFELFVGAIYSNQSFNILNQSNNLSGIASAKGNNIILKSRAASVSAIEIPFNLKYNFKLNKRQLFVSTGISSVQYFNEKIENTFVENERNKITGKDSFGNSFVQYELKQTENSVESSINSNKFELLGALNISAGILLPINNTNQSLIIEPYFKYSLNSITSQSVDYTNVGVQFRYNFSFKK